MTDTIKFQGKEVRVKHPLLRALAMVAILIVMTFLFIPSLVLTPIFRAFGRRGPLSWDGHELGFDWSSDMFLKVEQP